MIASGLVGGIFSVAAGGNFGSGFLAAGVGSLSGGLYDGHFDVGRMVLSAAVGGLASVLGGGKFQNGAVTGAFSYAASTVGSRSASGGARYAANGNGCNVDIGCIEQVVVTAAKNAALVNAMLFFPGETALIASGRGAIQIGFSGQVARSIPGTPVGGAGVGSFGLAIDTHLNVKAFVTRGFVGTLGGASTGAGVTLQVSDPLTVDDLAGPFNNVAINGGDGAGGSVDIFAGSSKNGPVTGFGFTFGASEGVSGTAGPTVTTVCDFNGCHK